MSNAHPYFVVISYLLTAIVTCSMAAAILQDRLKLKAALVKIEKTPRSGPSRNE